MSIFAYPAGIDLATGEGVFVSPHGAGVSLVSGRFDEVVVGRRAFVVVAALDFELCQGDRAESGKSVGVTAFPFTEVQLSRALFSCGKNHLANIILL